MSNTDSFIDEVTEEVRRDKLWGYARRYGWIGVLAVLLIVGGAAWREWQKAQATAAAQAFGDSILAALDSDQGAARIAALQDIATPNARAQAILDMMVASELVVDGRGAEAAQALRAVASNGEVPEIYRQIANLKALTQPDSGLSPQERQLELEALATPGGALRVLAEEQLALLALEQGDRDGALARLQALLVDAETTAGLRRRAAQLIVALGATPDGT